MASAADLAPKARAGLPWILAIMAVAIAVRGVAIFDAFWLDEIWSWAWVYHPSIYFGDLEALKIESALDIFTKLRHDNNHQLITLWMYLVGDLDQWFVYRLPSLLGGLGTIWLVMERTRGWAGVALPGGLFATSYVMVVYSTEARGYGLVCFFALLGYRLLDRRLAANLTFSIKDSMAYFGIVLLGLSSHFIFVHFYIAAILWTSVRTLQSQELSRGLIQLIRIHALPTLYILVLYFGFIHGIQVGGGDGSGLGHTLRDLTAWLSGSPNDWWGAVLGGAVLLGLAAYGASAPGQTHQLVFLVGACLIGPAGPLLLRSLNAEGAFETLYPRYFLIAATFVLLFAARGLLRLHQAGGNARTVSLVIAGILVIGNSARTARFLAEGRGSYLEAVTYMGTNSVDQSGRRVDFSAGSHQSIHSKMVLLYYRRFLPAGQRVGWVESPEARPLAAAPRWILIAHPWYSELPAEAKPKIQPMIQLPCGAVYRFAHDYSFYGPSGFSWQVFGRVK